MRGGGFDVYAIIAVSVVVLFVIWAILIGIIALTLLETLIIAVLALLFDITAWPPYLPIMITALIRILLNLFLRQQIENKGCM